MTMIVRENSGAVKLDGLYTVREAMRFLQIDSEAKVRRWLVGTDQTPAVIDRQYKFEKGIQEVGFYDLMEIRFIEYFRKKGISLQSIRKAASAARLALDTDHPFALSNVKFVTDRKRIFMQTAREENDIKLLTLTTGQYAMYDVFEKFLAVGVEFAPTTGLVKFWKPDPKTFPAVVLSPRIARGQPSIEHVGVPTSAIFSLWLAEGQNDEKVANWFNVTADHLQQAVQFELGLPA